MRLLFCFVAILLCASATSQVVWTTPPFPSADEPVVLHYDAAEGNGELAGVAPIFIHAGLILSLIHI